MFIPHSWKKVEVEQVEIKQKIYNKTVLMPIEIPYGDCCWGDGRICEHFDNEGGCPSCDLRFGPLKFDAKGQILKPSKCRTLQEQLGYKEGYEENYSEEDYEKYDVVYKEVYAKARK